MSGPWYLGTPYSLYEKGLDAAARDAAIQAAHLLRAGVPIFSPIAHSHPVAIHGGLDPLDHTLWLPLDEHFMEACIGLIVCKLPGWADSKGLEFEAEHFKAAGKAVVPMEPGLPPMRLIRSYEELLQSHGRTGVSNGQTAPLPWQGGIDP